MCNKVVISTCGCAKCTTLPSVTHIRDREFLPVTHLSYSSTDDPNPFSLPRFELYIDKKKSDNGFSLQEPAGWNALEKFRQWIFSSMPYIFRKHFNLVFRGKKWCDYSSSLWAGML